MKRIFLLAVVFLMAAVMMLSVMATDTATEQVTEVVTEGESLSEVVTESESVKKEDPADVLEELKAGLITMEDAIYRLAEKAGLTPEEAQAWLEQMLLWGDKYLADTDWWASFQASTRENIEFWVLCILAIVALVVIIFGALTLFRNNKSVKRIEYGTGSVMEDSSKNKDAISQTLANIEKKYEEMCDKCVIYEQERVRKDEEILGLQGELKAMKAKLEKTNKRMLQAELYNTQAHKLTLERSNLPLTDKSLLALWFAKAEASLKEEMSESDLAQVAKIMSTLEGGNGDA